MRSTRHTVVRSSRLKDLINGTESPAKRKAVLLAAVAAGVSALTTYSRAADVSWVFGGPSSSWSTAGNWSGGAVPTSADNVFFTNTGAAGANNTVTNVVDQTITVNSLQYQQRADASFFHTTQIDSGVTLNVTGAATGALAFVVGTQTSDATAIVETWITGAGTLNINSPTNDFWVQQGGSTQTSTAPFATLNMSQLANFVANVDEFGVGVGSSNIGGRARGVLTLAQNSTITANTLRMSAAQSSAQGPGSIFVGQNTTMNVNTMLLAERRGIGGMAFAPGVSNGSLTIRGKDGVSPVNVFQLGTGVGGDGSNGGGTFNFTNAGGNGTGAIDLWATTMLLGRGAGGRGTASFVYEQGIVRTNDLTVGYNGGQAGSGLTGQGTFQAQGTAQLRVDGNVTLGVVGDPSTQHSAAGTLNIGTTSATGGTATIAGDVLDGNGTSTMGIYGGTLTARHLGDATNAIDSLTINNGTLGVSLGAGVAANVGTLTADGTNVIKLGIAGPVSVGQQKLIDYATLAGAGFSSFSLDPKLPSRMAATLVDNPGDSIDLNVTAADLPKWNGNINGDWDINTTQNWLLANAGTPTTYLEDLATYATTDTVLFDDSATGTTTVNLTTNLKPSGVTVNNSSKSYTFAGNGAIIGGSSLTKTGTNTLTLANIGGNAFGVVTVSGGTLNIGDGSTAGGGQSTAAQFAVDTAGALVLNQPGNATFGSPISGTGLVEKIGSGTATLSGNSTHAGEFRISAGTVRVTNFNALGAATGSTTIAAGAQLDLGGITPDNVAGGFGAREFIIAGAGPDGSGAIVNTGNRQQNAFQKITLSADATIGGANNAGGTISATTPGRVDIRGGVAQLNLNGHTLTKTGDNQMTLVGVTANNGNIVVNQGTLAIEAGSNIDSNGSILFAGDNTRSQFFNLNGSVTRPIFYMGNGIQVGNNSSTLSTLGSPITLGNDIEVTQFQSTGGLVLNGNITEVGGARKITKSSPTLLGLGGNNTFTGGVVINDGTVQVQSAGALNSTTPNVVTFGASAPATAVLRTNGFSVAVGGLNTDATPGTPVVENANGTAATLTVNTAAASSHAYAGTIQDGAGGGALSVTKAGTGSQTLSGNNTYTGVTTVQAGRLILANNAKNPVLTGNGADIQGGRLVLDYNDTGVAPDVKSILTAGFAQTPKFSTGQLRTSNAADPAKGLGWVDDAGAKQETVGYTFYGDANLDGQVDVTDLGSLATNWQTSNVWAGGDFNYDGFVDVTDLGALATNWQQGVGNPLGKGSLEAAMQSVGLGNVSVPEPTALGVIGLASIGFASRRRRRA